MLWKQRLGRRLLLDHPHHYHPHLLLRLRRRELGRLWLRLQQRLRMRLQQRLRVWLQRRLLLTYIGGTSVPPFFPEKWGQA